MSWILRNKKEVIITLLWSILVMFAFTPLWLFSIFIAIFFLALAVNNRLVLNFTKLIKPCHLSGRFLFILL